MTGEELRKSRKKLGLTCQGMSDVLELNKRWAEQSVRRWEKGEYPVPGYIAKLVRFMLKYGPHGDQPDASG